MLSNLMHDVRIFLAGSLLLISAFTSAIAADKPAFEAEAAKRIGGASKVADRSASGGSLVGLSALGQGVQFARLPAASKLAIRYASVEVGTISVAVNDQPARKLNVHSSGALTNSFLHAIIDVIIPANAMLTIHVATNDVAVNIDRIVVGKGDLGLPPDIWNLPPLPVAAGPYSADWKALSRVYTVPEWWREAKFGAWAHWDPQSMPERGDWYARGMYMEGNGQYNFHIKNFGHPSEYGYKDICHNWVIDRWNPNELMDLYVEMGARYFMAMGVHHDNFDCWDSAYQPWNSVRVGPKVDVVGTWEKIARRHGLRFGIGFHNTPARTWGQFMTVRYTSDKKGPKQGVPYDALQTIMDGKGKWWEGMDPVDLYGPVHTGKNPLLSPFSNQFMWRVDDAIIKYHPDMIYFDEHAGDSQMDLGVRMGLGFLAPPLIANYYNKSLQWNHGNMDVVINLKGVGGRYNSFQNNPDLLPFVDRALVKSTEAIIESQIMAYPFQTETSIADWHYQTGQKYMDARSVIRSLMRNVSRNGSMLLNLTQHGRGDLDPQLTRICKDVGAWLKINGEAVYASRPFEVSGDNTVCYTRNQGKVYATLLDWSGGAITFQALCAGGATLGNVSKVELLGSDVALTFVQDDQGLTVTPAGPAQPLAGITNQQLALGCRVLHITHDKGWFNDDDPGAVAAGWVRRCNLGSGDFNNDLATSETTGDIWSCSFTGTSVSVVAPKDKGAGKIEIQIDGQSRATADLSTAGTRQAQQVVCELTGLSSGKHTISIVNRGPGPVAVDALIVRVTGVAAKAIPAPGAKLPPVTGDRVITAADVTVERVGTSIPVSAIGEPVGGVTLSSPRWFEATDSAVAYALVEGAIAPKDPKGKPINFRLLLPASWSRRAVQMGGGGINGFVPMMRGERPGSPTASFARYGSDSGHQMGGGRGGPGLPPRGGGAGDDWALNEEAIRNFGCLQMKKTHDAAMVIMERVYGERPRFNYYIGTSQGGREALTVAQRYPADYDGIVADVPIVNFSTLMLAPELIRIQEKPISNWVTRAKINAIRAEFMRQSDKLDGLADGVIHNYMAARALFDLSQGDPKRNPWAALRGPDGKDPNPADSSVNARLTDGQIETLKLVYSRYSFATPLANGVRSFGMWVPNTDPAGSGLIADRRFRGQEGAGDNAPMHAHLGVLGVTGFLMQNLSANPLDYVEGGPLNKRREEISEWLDSTNPDLSEFYRRGGKMIVTIGTDDTLASPGAQLDYFQSVLDKMGREQVDAFARFYVMPQAGHGLSGRSFGTNGDGQSIPTFPIPNRFDRTALITGWVERDEAPGKTLVVNAGARNLPLCSYPNYPRYQGGPPESAESYESTAPLDLQTP